jgi:hypothetical protein
MAPGEDAGKDLLDDRGLADDAFAQLIHHLLPGGCELLQIFADAVLAHAWRSLASW